MTTANLEKLSQSPTFLALKAQVTALQGGTFPSNISLPGQITCGTLTATTANLGSTLTLGDINFGLSFNGGSQPYLAFDSGDTLSYDRTANAFHFNIGGAEYARVTNAGIGTSGAVFPGLDATYFLNMVSGSPRINFDANDNLSYDRTNNLYNFNIGGTPCATLNASSLALPAGVQLSVGDGNFNLAKAGSTAILTVDTGDALYYDRAANKFYFQIGGVNVASIDGSGNLKIAGLLTQNTTP